MMRSKKVTDPMIEMITDTDVSDFVGNYEVMANGHALTFDGSLIIANGNSGDFDLTNRKLSELFIMKNKTLAERINVILKYDDTKELLKIFRAVKKFIYDIQFELNMAQAPNLHVGTYYAICEMLIDNRNLATAIQKASVDNSALYHKNAKGIQSRNVYYDWAFNGNLLQYEMITNYYALLALFMSPYRSFNTPIIRAGVYRKLGDMLHITRGDGNSPKHIMRMALSDLNDVSVSSVFRGLSYCKVGFPPSRLAWVSYRTCKKHNEKLGHLPENVEQEIQEKLDKE